MPDNEAGSCAVMSTTTFPDLASRSVRGYLSSLDDKGDFPGGFGHDAVDFKDEIRI